jgi:hypothetical protein
MPRASAIVASTSAANLVASNARAAGSVNAPRARAVAPSVSTSDHPAAACEDEHHREHEPAARRRAVTMSITPRWS